MSSPKYWTKEMFIKFLNFLWQTFNDKLNAYKLFVKDNNFKSKKQVRRMKRYLKFRKNLLEFIKLADQIVESGLSTKEYFRRKNKGTKHCYKWYYDMKERLTSMIIKRYVCFRKVLFKLPIKLTVELKYKKKTRRAICNHYYSCKLKGKFINKTTFWMQLVNGDIRIKKKFFPQMSYNTFSVILNEDPRAPYYKKFNVENIHKFRHKIAKVGGMQLDIKVFGVRQTGTGKWFYVLDAIEMCTRTAWGVALRRPTTACVMEALHEIMNFFNSIKIKIKMIRTDNAMMFKNINFVKSNLFNQFCKDNEIKHQFTPLKQPECDGCIERLHRTYDNELVDILVQTRTFEELSAKLKEYLLFYNYERYHEYRELSFLPKKQRKMIPVNSIKFFNNYNTTRQAV